MRAFLTTYNAISKLCSLINAWAVAFLGNTRDIQQWHQVRQPPVCQLIDYQKIFKTQPFEVGKSGLFYFLTQFSLSLFYCFHFGRTGFLLSLHWQWGSMNASSWRCLFCCSAWYPNRHSILESAWDYERYILVKDSRIIKVA